MYGISGIKEQEKLEKLPLFNKKTAGVLIGKKGDNLDKKIQRLLDKEYLINLKKGLYVSKPYLDKIDDLKLYGEFLANELRSPSYLSHEYMLSEYNLIPEAVESWTSVTIKSTRKYSNKLGNFVYKNIKDDLFTGYLRLIKNGFKIYKARRAKALFDFLYLKTNLSNDLNYELKEGLRINWNVFNNKDLKEFYKYVKISDMKKMNEIYSVIRDIKDVS